MLVDGPLGLFDELPVMLLDDDPLGCSPLLLLGGDSPLLLLKEYPPLVLPFKTPLDGTPLVLPDKDPLGCPPLTVPIELGGAVGVPCAGLEVDVDNPLLGHGLIGGETGPKDGVATVGLLACLGGDSSCSTGQSNSRTTSLV